MQRGRKTKIQMSKLITVPELSQRSGYNSQSIYDWIRNGKIVGYETDGKVRVHSDQKLPPE
jgi:hypothetical protein